MLDLPTIPAPPLFSNDVGLPRPSQARVAPVPGFVPFASEWLERSLPARFEEQVARYPDGIALKVGARALTYRELNHCANRVAHALVQQEATAAAPIAVLLVDQVSAIVALLAILKSGNFSVLIDPTMPQKEIAAILHDAQAARLITDQAHWGLAHTVATQVAHSCQLFPIDSDLSHLPTTNLERAIPAESYAQVVYTSGSTGKPKGVIRTHAMLLRLSMAHANSYYISPQDRMMAPAPILFGSSLSVVVAALLNGATLMPFEIKTQGMTALAAWLRQEEITTYHSVASIFRHFLTTLDATDQFPAVRVIKLGGEAIYRQDIERYKRHFADHCVVRVGLASTETNAYSWYFLDKTTTVAQAVVPVGYTLPDQEVRIWNEDRQPVAPSEIGEIVVRSRYLAPGYWRNPALTAAKFLADPEGGNNRFYLTGDLGRLRPDGMLEHLGRKDQMVKVRGYRIELAAIEGALLELPGVREAVVITVEDAERNQRLVAYLVPQAAGITIDQLRQDLEALLPDYMIPPHFVILDELPLLPNGKVDRKALPVPAMGRPRLATPYAPARNPLEGQVVKLWEDLLGIHPIGVDDDFFALGGYSLVAARVTAALHSTFGVAVPLAVLMAAPTVAGIAGYLHQQQEGAAPRIDPVNQVESLVPIRQAGTRPPFFLVPGGGGGETEFLLYAPLLYQLGDDQPVYGLQARGLDGIAPPHRDVESMAAAYVQAIRTVQPQGPYFLGGECTGGKIAFAMACYLQAQGERVDLLVLLDTILEVTPPPPTYARYRLRWVRRRLAHHWQQVRQLPLRAQVRHLQKEVGVVWRLFTPKPQESTQARHRRQVQQNYRYAVASYRPSQPFAGNLSLIYSQQILAGPSAAAWQSVTNGSVAVHAVPGVHQTYLGPYLNDTAACLRACLGRAQADQLRATQETQPHDFEPKGRCD